MYHYFSDCFRQCRVFKGQFRHQFFVVGYGLQIDQGRLRIMADVLEYIFTSFVEGHISILVFGI